MRSIAAMVTRLFAVLLAQAALGVPIACGFVFAVLFGTVYSVLLLVNLLADLVHFYERQPRMPLVPTERRAIIALIIAFLGAVVALEWIWSHINGRFTRNNLLLAPTGGLLQAGRCR